MKRLFLSLLIAGMLLLGACIKIDETSDKSNNKKEDLADTEKLTNSQKKSM